MDQISIWKCDTCYTDAVEYGMICDGYSLIKYEGKYHILGGQGHKGDILFTFPVDPWSDPDPNDTEGASEELKAACHKWLEDFMTVDKQFVLPVYDGWSFIASLEKSGYTDGSAVAFVFDKCGKMIEGKKFDIIPVEKGHWRYGIIYRNGCSQIKVDGYCPAFKTCGIHEIYYDPHGKVSSWSADPLVVSETHAGLERTLKEMLKAFDGPSFVENKEENKLYLTIGDCSDLKKLLDEITNQGRTRFYNNHIDNGICQDANGMWNIGEYSGVIEK